MRGILEPHLAATGAFLPRISGRNSALLAYFPTRIESERSNLILVTLFKKPTVTAKWHGRVLEAFPHFQYEGFVPTPKAQTPNPNA